jgi:acyl transferase domain-containing protein/NAD(P)-dependent dehydrogenase (short-subunit alcohol dehydrogenase family)/acyl carrier protein
MMDATATQLARQHEAIKKARQQIESLSARVHQPIAIVGLGCKLPGAEGPGALWDLLIAGQEALCDVPPERWEIDAYYAPDPGTQSKTYARRAGYLADVDRFDAHFFGISPREAEQMDPQQRLLLEVSYHALEHAQIPVDALRGEPVGVFVGISSSEYAVMTFAGSEGLDAYSITGTAMNAAAGRLAYAYGFNGPAMAIDTACSSSLVAIHQACRSLINEECHTALAGGVQCLLTPEPHIALAQNKVLSASGHCSPFSARADGLVRGEGCGVLVLKRLSDALEQGCPILAVIRASHVNQDGASSGLTVPNGQAQQALIAQTLARGKLSGAQVDYVEAHGTGTALGDPIELRALDQALGQGRARALQIGSIKANLGHLEAASGVAGVIKTVLALQHRLLPAQINAEVLTPHIAWETSSLHVVREHTPIDYAVDRPFHAGVSSFGFTGTNAHLILQDPLSACGPTVPQDAAAPVVNAPQLLAVSARHPAALRTLLDAYRTSLARSPDWRAQCDAANAGRAHHAHRRAFVAEDLATLLGQLEQATRTLVVADAPEPAAMAWLFTGQGSQYVDMARELFDHRPEFRALMHDCDAAIARHLGHSILPVIWGEPGASLSATRYTQPALFCLQYSLSHYLGRLNLQPQCVLGHSIGEYAAAVLAGVFGLDDAARMIVYRGRLMEELCSPGAMLVLFTDAAQARALIDGLTPQLAIAVCNGPRNHVVSGPVEAIDRVAARAEAVAVRCVRLAVSHAFHSPMMQPMLEAFRDVVQQTRFAPPRITFVSSALGRAANSEVVDPEYWVAQVDGAVHFETAMHALLAQTGPGGVPVGQCVEIGPGDQLIGMARAFATAPGLEFVPLLRPRQALSTFGNGLKCLYESGAPLRWPRAPLRDRRAGELPSYPFERTRFWLPQASRRSAQETYRIEWREQPPASLPRHAASRVLLIADAHAFRDHVHRTLTDQGDTVRQWPISALMQAASAESPQAWPEADDCDRILFIAGADGIEHDAAASVQCVHAFLSLVRGHYAALVDGRLRIGGVLRFRQGGYLPLDAALAGLCRSLLREDPALGLDLIGLDPEQAPDSRAALLARELSSAASTNDREIVCIDQHRWVPRLVEHTGLASHDGMRIRSDRAYLITGGSGALGVQCALALVDEGARDLLLVSRRATAGKTDALIAHARARGVRVTLHSADVSDEAQVRALLARIASEHLPLGGIVHAAGQLADAGLQQLTPGHFERVFAPKVAAAYCLDRLTRDLPLDFFVVLSSLAAVLGAAGQANYAAANACLDALMQQRHAQGLPALSLNLGPVAGAGMASTPAIAQAMRQAGLMALSAERLRHGFGQWLRQSLPQLVVARFDWTTVRARHTASDLPLLEDFLPARAAEASLPATSAAPVPPAAQTPAQVPMAVRRAIARVLGLQEIERIRDSDTLMGLGMDSITLVELRRTLAIELGCELGTHVLFDFPQIGKLVRHLTAHLAEHAGAEHAGAEHAGAHPPEPLDREAPDRLAAASAAQARAGIAIVGMACRFPGGIDSPDRFWSALLNGEDLIGEIDPLRWDARRCRDDGALATTRAGIIEGVDRFDGELFGISPREARCMDPQQRLLLEVGWEALERAGYDFSRQAVTGGVFVGPGPNEYARRFERDTAALSHHLSTGNALSVTAGRLSFLLDWQGPALVVDTACSSSLMAVHLAAAALDRHECDIALAGGVNLLLSSETSILLSKGGMLSADGRCKSFDAAADGYVRSEGCGLVVLKRIDDAIADGDEILAVIRGSAANQDGHSQGLTAPNGQAQQRVLRAALARAGVDEQAVELIEAHGTGTPLGDPIEMAAIRQVYAPGDTRDTPLWVSSVKTIMGHAEAAAGIAGLIKTVLCLQRGRITPHPHFKTLNPEIGLGTADLRIPRQAEPWMGAGSRFAAVSAFGFSGTNVHMVLESAPAQTRMPVSPPRAPVALRISAASETALRAYLRAYRDTASALSGDDAGQHRYCDLCIGSWYRAERDCTLVLHAPTAAALVAQIDALLQQADLDGHKARTALPPAALERRFARDCVPVYPFQRQRYWLDAQPPARPRCPGIRLGARSAQRVVYAVDYWHEPPYRLQDHLVHGEAAVPAAAHLALLVQMLHDLERDTPEHLQALEFTDVVCENILVVDADTSAVRYEFVRAQPEDVTAGTGPGAAYQIQVVSESAGQERRHLHARARTAASAAAAMPSIPQPPQPPLTRVDGTTFYDHLYAPDIVLTQSFRRIADIEQHVGVSVSTLDWQAHADPLFSPGELDSALQTIALATLCEDPGRSHMPGATVPFAIDRIVIDPRHRPASTGTATRPLTCVTRLAHEDPARTTFIHDLRIAEPGQPAFVTIEGLVTREVGAARVKPAALPSTRYLVERWRERPPSEATTAGPARLDDQRIALLDADDSALCRSLQSLLCDAGATILPVSDPGQLRSLVAEGAVSRALFWLRGDPDEDSAIDAWRSLAHRLVHALKSFMDGNDARSSRDALVGFQIVSPAGVCVNDDEIGSVFPGWGVGLCKSLHLERADESLSLIDIDAATVRMRCPQLVEAIARPTPSLIAFREGRTFQLEIGEIEAGPAVAQSQPHFRCVEDAIYIITGGLGDIAIETGRWLIAQGATRLALLGRSAPDAATRERIARMTSGLPAATVEYHACDVGDFASLAGVIETIRGSGTIRGVFHSAGVLADSGFRQATPAQIDAVMRAKVSGSWNLHRLSRDLPLDAFVLYSSLASLFGAAGQSIYAASNAFMDQLAVHRRRSKLPAISIHWGPWDAVGMASRRVAGGAQVFKRLAPQRAIADLAQILAMDMTGLGVAEVDGSALAAQWRGGGRVPALVGDWLAARAPAAAAPPAAAIDVVEDLRRAPTFARADLVKQALARIVRQIMGLSPTAALADSRSFQEYGFDSLMSIELKTRVQDCFGLHVPSTLMFDYPNLDSLSAHLLQSFNLKWDPPPAPAPGLPDDRPAGRPLFTQIHDDMQESDLALALKNLLVTDANGKR